MRMLFSMAALLASCTLATNVIASVQIHPNSGLNAGPLSYATQFFNFDDQTDTDPNSPPAAFNSNAVNSSGTIGVLIASNGQVATGSVDNVYAAPWVSGNNGNNFGYPSGNQPVGLPGVGLPDVSPYLTAGSSGSITLTLASPSTYFGILWGSVDTYNKIQFLDTAGNVIDTFGGADVYSPPVGARDYGGTAYINFVSTVAIGKVVLSNSSPTFAFEFDNIATGNVPEATTIAVWSGLSLLGWVAYRRKMAA